MVRVRMPAAAARPERLATSDVLPVPPLPLATARTPGMAYERAGVDMRTS